MIVAWYEIHMQLNLVYKKIRDAQCAQNVIGYPYISLSCSISLFLFIIALFCSLISLIRLSNAFSLSPSSSTSYTTLILILVSEYP